MSRSNAGAQGVTTIGPALYRLSVGGALTMMGIGAIAGIRPALAARAYGVPAEGESARAYMTAAGVRDLSFGGLVLVFALLRDRRALGASAALGSVIAIGDGLIALRHGPDPKKVLPMHWGSAAACIVAAAALLRAE